MYHSLQVLQELFLFFWQRHRISGIGRAILDLKQVWRSDRPDSFRNPILDRAFPNRTIAAVLHRHMNNNFPHFNLLPIMKPAVQKITFMMKLLATP
jgi:hypothetical protein